MVIDDVFPCTARGGCVVDVNDLPTTSVDSFGKLSDNSLETKDFEGGAEDDHHVRVGAQVGGCEGADLLGKGMLFTVEDDVWLGKVRIYAGYIY